MPANDLHFSTRSADIIDEAISAGNGVPASFEFGEKVFFPVFAKEGNLYE